MNDRPRDPKQELNPALKSRTETTYDTSSTTPAPVDSTSVQHEEGRAWPMIWLVVTLLCVVLAIYLFVW